MKKTYVYNKETGTMVEKSSEAVVQKAPRVVGDIEPYQTVGPDAGRWITSRSQHRAYLREHNLIEVGNERSYFDGKRH
jgi:hypothetical protein